jgi:hypothetical protein
VNLLWVEMQRALHRRVVWGLIALAVALTALAGVVAFIDSRDLDVRALTARGETHPAVMADWWDESGDDPGLAVAALALALGGIIGGATVVGAEWKAGTVATVLTWEPRRLRFHAARSASAALLAFVIGLVLQVVFLAAFLPSVIAHGTTAGVDADWWMSLTAAMFRIAFVTAASALLGTALATIGRNTAFAIVVAWLWLAVGEAVVRGLRPAWSRLLLGDSATTVLLWHPPDVDHPVFGTWAACLVACSYVGLLVVVGTLSFARRDVT